MHRFIALRELKSSAGASIVPGDFVPDLEQATPSIQAANVNQCMVFDLSGQFTIDPDERNQVRRQVALIGDIAKTRGIDVLSMVATAKKQVIPLNEPKPAKIKKTKAKKKATVI